MELFQKYITQGIALRPSDTGLWLSPYDGIIELAPGQTHINHVVNNPETYKIDRSYILSVYDKYNEILGSEGYARNEILLKLLKKGFVRVRKQRQNKDRVWAIETIRFDSRTKDRIFSFLMNQKYKVDSFFVTLLDKDGKSVIDTFRSIDKILESFEFDELNLNESSLSRLYSHTQRYSCGMMTAFRGNNTRKENLTLNKKLSAILQSKSYSITKVKGAYIENMGSKNQKEVGEDSFFVCNMNVEGDDGGKLERDLIALGAKFDQDSILSIPFEGKAVLIGTSNRSDAYPGEGNRVYVGNPKFGKAAGKFFSRVRGRQFAYESVEYVPYPSTIMGKWAMETLSEMEDHE